MTEPPPKLCICPGNVEDGRCLSGFSGGGGDWVPSLCRRMLGSLGFKAMLNTPAGIRVARQQVHRLPFMGAALLCLAWRGMAFWDVGSWLAHTVHPALASLPCAHPSSLPASPSALGRPGLGAVGRCFLHGSL